MVNLGDKFPNFKAKTTIGDIQFHDWLGNKWGLLFSHPADFTPVCTTELGRVAKLVPEFQKRGVQVIALSCDSVESHSGWIEDIKVYARHGGEGFPYPIIADESRELAVQLGMLDPAEKDKDGLPLTCRAVFLIDPNKRLRLSILYPATTGRNFDEILRAVDSVQLTEKHKVATPADWKLEDDTENFMRWKLMGCNLRMRKAVLPHIFTCQDRPSIQPVSERAAVQKRRRKEIVAAIEVIDDTQEPEDLPDFPPIDPSDQWEEMEVPPCHPPMAALKVDWGIQVRSPSRSRLTQTGQLDKVTVATSPFKQATRSTHTSPMKNVLAVTGSNCSSQEESLSSDCSFSGLSSDESSEGEEAAKYREESFRNLSFFIEKDPKLYLGVCPRSYRIISLLCENIPASDRTIMLCLKKVKLNDQVKVLGNEFGLHYSTVSRVLRDNMPLIASYMQDLIYWPNEESRRRTLPTAFLANFSHVTCIIDCLEIAIEKPQNPLHQVQSWSQYKKANTIKYLISCLPNGFITFISEGYLGRASDEAISTDCGFLDKLSPGSTVMADRGFKHLEGALAKRSCKLMRPPYVSAGEVMSQGNACLTKQVASLRTHVERVIGRIRDFSILKPSTVMDHNLVKLADYMIIIACALINLERPIVRT